MPAAKYSRFALDKGIAAMIKSIQLNIAVTGKSSGVYTYRESGL